SQHIVAPPTVEKIVARATGEEVGGCISEKIVAAAAADGALDRLELFRETRPKLDIGGKVDGDVVGLVAVLDDVETVAAVKEVKAGTPDEHIIAGATIGVIVAAQPFERVVAAKPADGVVLRGADKQVRTVGTVDVH